jgi:hypothetical protein
MILHYQVGAGIKKNQPTKNPVVIAHHRVTAGPPGQCIHPDPD